MMITTVFRWLCRIIYCHNKVVFFHHLYLRQNQIPYQNAETEHVFEWSNTKLFRICLECTVHLTERIWCNRACKWVTIHGDPHDWSWLGTGHKNNILTMDDSCSFRLMNIRKMHIIIAHVYICPKTECTARKMAFFITSQDRQTQVPATSAMATTIIID